MSRMIRHLWHRQDGVSAVEFALVAPIILLLLSAAVDFGSVVHARMEMEDTAQAAMAYAMGAGQPFDSAKAIALAQNLERIVVSSLGSDMAVAVDVNHGAQRTYIDGSSQAGGNAALAAACYCPNVTDAGVQWNAAVACGAPCSNGGGSGKFAYLQMSRPFDPIFGSYGLVEDGYLRLQSIGRIE